MKRLHNSLKNDPNSTITIRDTRTACTGSHIYEVTGRTRSGWNQTNVPVVSGSSRPNQREDTRRTKDQAEVPNHCSATAACNGNGREHPGNDTGTDRLGNGLLRPCHHKPLQTGRAQPICHQPGLPGDGRACDR